MAVEQVQREDHLAKPGRREKGSGANLAFIDNCLERELPSRACFQGPKDLIVGTPPKHHRWVEFPTFEYHELMTGV